MMTSSEYRYIARESLRGRWPMAALITLVATLLGAYAGSSGSTDFQVKREELVVAWPDVRSLLAVIAGTITIFVVVYAIVRILVGASVELGLKQYHINLVLRREQQPFPVLFSRMDYFGKALGLRIVSGIFIFLWSLLFVIPGIVAAYRYSMATYLMAQHPEMGVFEALDRSKELMQGNKADLFFLDLSFIGWAILASLLYGIGYIVLNPYTEAARAAFYLDRTGQLTVRR